ncbi:MAG: DUF2079 domain-containing protein [Candidatus Omnitrophica bacterium]|nr:DUF2079 domain-containing protein [Candidatus Omnitrophota bacterium]
MNSRLKEAAKSVSLKDAVFILAAALIILNYIFTSSYKNIALILGWSYSGPVSGYFRNLTFLFPALLIYSCLACLFFLYIFILASFKDRGVSSTYLKIALSPIALLYLWRGHGEISTFVIPPLIVLTTIAVFFAALLKQQRTDSLSPQKDKAVIFGAVFLLAIFFICVNTQKYAAFTSFNPKDFAIYNQTFWNTIQGRIFQNSAYGSNFACHNSPFLFLLVPFYYFFPHPLTLIFLKIVFLSLAAIPFYLIARNILRNASVIPATIAFMFYPYIISQNISAPHEIAYAPFFILFTYYFYRTARFWPFLVFLSLTLSIKEHLSLIAVMFGVLAMLEKRKGRWVSIPIISGTVWALFSLWIILHFQKIYSSHPDAAWLIASFGKRLGQGSGSLINFILGANIFSWFSLKWVFMFFLPLLVIPPFLSLTGILGLPELLINLASDNLAMFTVPWHYNVTFSCFLIIAALEGLKKISERKEVKSLALNAPSALFLLTTFMSACVLMHAYLWLPFTGAFRDKDYVYALEKAIASLPPDAYVSVPPKAAVRVSCRQKYNLLGKGELADYILIDRDTSKLLSAKKIHNDYYTEIFNEEGVVVLKKR